MLLNRSAKQSGAVIPQGHFMWGAHRKYSTRRLYSRGTSTFVIDSVSVLVITVYYNKINKLIPKPKGGQVVSAGADMTGHHGRIFISGCIC